jgi:hypothetical protein
MPRAFALVTDRQLLEWAADMPLERIAVLTGSTTSSISRRLRELGWTDPRPGPKDPDEATIRQRCWEVQSRWSEQERRRRAGLRRASVTVVHASDLGLASFS